jgi:hypothetical protein
MKYLPQHQWACVLALCAIGLAGCNQYWERKDTISFAAGDAVAHNSALETPDPWPHGVYDEAILSNGNHAQRAVERYRLEGAASQGGPAAASQASTAASTSSAATTQ